MTLKEAWKCSVSFEETVLNLNRFQLTTCQGDDMFQYHMVINSVRPSGPFFFCSPTEKISVIRPPRFITNKDKRNVLHLRCLVTKGRLKLETRRCDL